MGKSLACMESLGEFEECVQGSPVRPPPYAFYWSSAKGLEAPGSLAEGLQGSIQSFSEALGAHERIAALMDVMDEMEACPGNLGLSCAAPSFTTFWWCQGCDPCKGRVPVPRRVDGVQVGLPGEAAPRTRGDLSARVRVGQVGRAALEGMPAGGSVCRTVD